MCTRLCGCVVVWVCGCVGLWAVAVMGELVDEWVGGWIDRWSTVHTHLRNHQVQQEVGTRTWVNRCACVRACER